MQSVSAELSIFEPSTPAFGRRHDRWAKPPASDVRFTEEAPSERPGTVLGGKYRLLSCLGRGALSEVYLARDERLDRSVAVKLMPNYGTHPVVTRERFDAEVRASLAVEHENVVRSLDFGHTEGGRPFLVSEALRGETFGACLRRNVSLSVEGALRIVREAARGLAAVHRAGFVHRDIKPENLFLCDERVHGVSLKLIDFGFATPSGSVETDPLRVLGTLGYIAPEQAIGEAVDTRSDVYSLGIVLFRALTGELPFDGCGDKERLAHHLVSPVPPVAWWRDDVTPAVDAVIRTATRKHPENRYCTPDDLLADLDRALRRVPSKEAPLSVAPDAYQARTELGRRVITAITRAL